MTKQEFWAQVYLAAIQGSAHPVATNRGPWDDHEAKVLDIRDRSGGDDTQETEALLDPAWQVSMIAAEMADAGVEIAEEAGIFDG